MFKSNQVIAPILARLTEFPPFKLFTAKVLPVLAQYSREIKIALIGLFVFLLVVVSLRLGLTLSRLFAPTPPTPAPIPGITPTPSPVSPSAVRDLRDAVQNFSVLLPDPAPPAVDPEISLEL